jgi:hypothetical protein
MMLDAALPKVLEWLKVKEPKTAGIMQEEGQAGNRWLETRTSGALLISSLLFH